MTSSTLDNYDDPTAASLRSRASSIITTTTKFSLETLSQDDRSSIVAIRRRLEPGPSDRPRSLMSMTSVAYPAPPYSATQNSTLLLPTHEDGNFQLARSSPPELAEPPAAETASLDEASAPSPIPSPVPSGTATPSPNTPPDPDDPHARIAYYNHVVRTLDQNYTAELDRLRSHHAQELAVIRNEIDAAYRAQWKAKNREIERIREEVAVEIEQGRAECEASASRMELALQEQKERMEGEMQVAVEKARHEVEDMWERRWSDRGKVEREERKRAEEETRKRWKIRLGERDERWRDLMEELVRKVDAELCDRVLLEIKSQDDLMEMGFM